MSWFQYCRLKQNFVESTICSLWISNHDKTFLFSQPNKSLLEVLVVDLCCFANHSFAIWTIYSLYHSWLINEYLWPMTKCIWNSFLPLTFHCEPLVELIDFFPWDEEKSIYLSTSSFVCVQYVLLKTCETAKGKSNVLSLRALSSENYWWLFSNTQKAHWRNIHVI